MEEYLALTDGIRVDAAERIIGCAGTEMARSSYGRSETVLMSWPAETGLFANMNATFDDGKLVGKAKLGLR
jgi:hypothetical protein